MDNTELKYDEAMKTFIPEYYQYIGEIDSYKSSFIKGKTYKIINKNDLEASFNFIDEKGTPNGYEGVNWKKFKPSTKEAYDAQFVVKEPLPQFKVIESIETITKVENNEGNQFFIGDIVISDSGFVQTIKSFRYNVNKDNVLATTNVCNQISIARLEHYIEPKVEETLLEKAKRLYPIGTKFKSATSKRIFTIKNHIQEPCQNPNTIVFSTNEINANNKFYACVHSHICEWAEIIE